MLVSLQRQILTFQAHQYQYEPLPARGAWCCSHWRRNLRSHCRSFHFPPPPRLTASSPFFHQPQHLPALAQTPTLKLKAVYSRTSTSATSIASACLLHPATAHNVDLYFDVPGADGSADSRGQGDLHTLLLRSDIKTVILSLPIGIQGSVIERCWESGKNVISEKPIAKDLKEAKRLIGLWETRYRPMGLKWIVGEQFPVELIVSQSWLESSLIDKPFIDIAFLVRTKFGQGQRVDATYWCATKLQYGILFLRSRRYVERTRLFTPPPSKSHTPARYLPLSYAPIRNPLSRNSLEKESHPSRRR